MTTFSVSAVYTTAMREKYAQKLGNLYVPTGVLSYVSTFKVGLGGWIGSVPRTPDPSLTDLDIVEDQSRPVLDKRYPSITDPPYIIEFSKAPASITSSGSVLTVTCELTNSEYNNDGTGSAPVIWELGLFDTDDTMLVYATFSGVEKISTRALSFPVNLSL